MQNKNKKDIDIEKCRYFFRLAIELLNVIGIFSKVGKAELIEEKIPQNERLIRLNKIKVPEIKLD